MFISASSLLLIFAAASSRAQTAATPGLSVGSPALYECQPAAFVYTCDKPACNIAIRPFNDPSETLVLLSGLSSAGGTATWTVNVTEGSSVLATITDASGVSQYSANLTVFPGSKTCLTGGAGKGGAGAGAGGSVSTEVQTTGLLTTLTSAGPSVAPTSIPSTTAGIRSTTTPITMATGTTRPSSGAISQQQISTFLVLILSVVGMMVIGA